MKKDPALTNMLCRKKCRYYRHDKSEDLACQGYLVAGWLIEAGKLPDIYEINATRYRIKEDDLVRKMCENCSFHESDCDFMIDRNLPPCGGFSLLAQFLGEGQLTIEDIPDQLSFNNITW